MKDFPTYYDLKYQSSSTIFESEEIKKLDPDVITQAEKNFHIIVEKLKNEEEIDEGFLSGLASGAIGALAGPTIGRAICKVLGIDEKGHLGKLLTSRLVTAALGFTVGK